MGRKLAGGPRGDRQPVSISFGDLWRGCEGDHELRYFTAFLAAVELLFCILVLRRVADQEAVIETTCVHGLDQRSHVPLAPAAARTGCGGCAGRRRLVVPGHAIFSPAGIDLQSLNGAPGLRGGSVHP
jgi:hypothetical protein